MSREIKLVTCVVCGRKYPDDNLASLCADADRAQQEYEKLLSIVETLRVPSYQEAGLAAALNSKRLKLRVSAPSVNDVMYACEKCDVGVYSSAELARTCEEIHSLNDEHHALQVVRYRQLKEADSALSLAKTHMKDARESVHRTCRHGSRTTTVPPKHDYIWYDFHLVCDFCGHEWNEGEHYSKQAERDLSS